MIVRVLSRPSLGIGRNELFVEMQRLRVIAELAVRLAEIEEQDSVATQLERSLVSRDRFRVFAELVGFPAFFEVSLGFCKIVGKRNARKQHDTRQQEKGAEDFWRCSHLLNGSPM